MFLNCAICYWVQVAVSWLGQKSKALYCKPFFAYFSRGTSNRKMSFIEKEMKYSFRVFRLSQNYVDTYIGKVSVKIMLILNGKKNY